MKLALFLPNWIGDAVMATPALRALREGFRAAEIVGVMRPYVADVLTGLDLLDRTMLHEPKGTRHDRRGWQFVRQLRCERFDLAVLFPNSLRSGWLAWVSGAKRRVGFARDMRSWLLTDPLAPKSRKTPNPVIDEYLRLARHLGCDQPSRQMELAVTPADEQRLTRFWSVQDERPTGRGVVSLNPGGAFGAAKHWPTESFARLAQRLAREQGKTVLVLCGPAERDEAREIARRADDRHVVSLAEEAPSLGLTKAAVKHSQLLVTTDSGPRHFAPPFGVPVVSLFGPTHIAWSHTYYAHEIALQIPIDCGPCQQRVCPLEHHRCMRDLCVDDVFDAARKVLEQHDASDVAA